MSYAELVQIEPGEEREQFVQVIRELDGAYLNWTRKSHG